MAAHQAPLSTGFSRQEYWSGVPFPPPVHESEKWKWSHSVVSNSSWPHVLQPTSFLHPWDFPGKSTGVRCHHLLWQIAYEVPKCSLRPTIVVTPLLPACSSALPPNVHCQSSLLIPENQHEENSWGDKSQVLTGTSYNRTKHDLSYRLANLVFPFISPI